MYISPETHENLKKIVRLFCYEHHTTTSSLADTIIFHHIEMYRDILNEEHREYMHKLFDWGNKSDPEGKEPESLEDNDSDEERVAFDIERRKVWDKP